MLTRFLLFLALGCPVWLHAQQPAAAVAEPQYMYQVAALNPDGSLLGLESEKLSTQNDTHNRFVYVKGSSEQTVPGERSPIRLGGNAVFVVKWVQGMDAIDPNTMVKLRPFVVQKGLRTLPLHSGKAVIFAGVKSQSTPDNSLPVSFKKYGQNSLLITPSAPLPAGEYVLEANGGFAGVNCFGVDAGGASSPAPAAARPVAPPAPAPVPPPVTGTAGDFPAGPGLPVLHTARTPIEGCHWAPFVSREAGIALLVQQCANAASSTETKGLVSVYGKGPEGQIDVFTKPAGQSLDTAIRQQVGATLPSPARTACHAVPAKDQWEHSSWKQYEFTVTAGPLLRKYQSATPGDNLPCDPWEQVDTAVAFLYRPAENQTRFLFVQMGQEEQSWDVESIQFLPVP